MDPHKSDASDRLRMVMTELTQPHILERTAARLGIKVTSNELRKKHLFKIAIQAQSPHNLEVEIWTYSKEWARDWTESLVQEYLEFRREKHEANHRVTKPLATDMSNLSIESLPLEIAGLNQRIDEMSRVRINLQEPHLDVIAKLSLLSSFDKAMNRKGAGAAVTSPLEGPNSAPWQMLDEKQRAIRVEMHNLSRIYPSEHTQLLALSTELESVNEELERELRSALERFDVEFQDLVHRKTAAEVRLPEYNEFRRNNPKDLREENVHEFGQLARHSIVDKTAPAVEVTDLGEKAGRRRLTHLQELKDQPVWPQRVKRVLFSLLFGGLLAFAVPFLIRNPATPNLEQVEKILEICGLGSLPTINSPAKNYTALANDFDLIRKNLLSTAAPTKVLQVAMVTSALPNEGKTLVSSNLAAAFAQVEARTLLVDTDVRRGCIHRLFGYRRVPGLTDVLLDEVPIEDAIRQTTHRNRFVLTAGRRLETGNDVLGSAKFGQLMTQLREEFDRIVIDTPPVLGLSETLILQRHVDSVLFVISGRHTSLRAMKAAIGMLQRNAANLCGFVLNRAGSPREDGLHIPVPSTQISLP